MSRRLDSLERLLEAWARWNAADQQAGAGLSMLARWMDGKGHMVFGTGTSPKDADALEILVEATVLKMFTEAPMRADVLRLEFAAGYQGVCERRGIVGYDPRGATHLKNALHLGIGLRTYRRRLAEAKAQIQQALAENKKHGKAVA